MCQQLSFERGEEPKGNFIIEAARLLAEEMTNNDNPYEVVNYGERLLDILGEEE